MNNNINVTAYNCEDCELIFAIETGAQNASCPNCKNDVVQELGEKVMLAP